MTRISTAVACDTGDKINTGVDSQRHAAQDEVVTVETVRLCYGGLRRALDDRTDWFSESPAVLVPGLPVLAPPLRRYEPRRFKPPRPRPARDEPRRAT